MTKSSPKSKLKKAFGALCKARDTEEIINLVIACCLYKDDSEGQPLTATLAELQAFTDAALSAQYVDCPAIVSEKSNWYDVTQKATIERIVGTDYNTWLDRSMNEMIQATERIAERAQQEGKTLSEMIEELKADSDRRRAELEETLDLAPDSDKGRFATAEDFRKSHEKRLATTIFDAEQFHAIGLFLCASQKVPTKVPLEWIHEVWVRSRKEEPSIQHPLAPLVKTWLREQTPKVEPERRTDTGILHHAIGETHHAPRLPMTVMETMPPGKPEQMMLITNLPQVDLQLELPGFEFPESELVPALPLEASETIGGRPSHQGGGAPISQRLFFNILVEYAQKQRGLYGTSRLNTNYRDVKSWLYPKGTTNPKSVLIPRLYKGMYELHNFRFLWERRAWNIISVDSLPTPAIRPDDALTFTVRMPTGMNTSNGALIGIEPMRIYGAQSAPKFRAWVRLAYLWDAAKVRNGGKRIYATVPEVLRNSDGYLVDAKGEIILTGDLYHTKGGWKFRNGNQTQKAWYHPLAIQTGEPMRNPQADKVPVLSDSDMVKLFYDHNERRGSAFHSALSEARRYALEMQDESRIVVEEDQENEKTGIKGWRILEPHHG